MAAEPTISVVAPAFDEERSVALLFEELQAALDPLPEPWEVVFVDDGSTDGTFGALTRLHAAHENVRVVRLRRNFGKSAALAAGFEQARGEVVVTIDADLQDDPAEIPRLLAKLEEGFDLVSGWKSRRRDPWTRRLLSRVFNRLAGAVSGLALHDVNCGLKAYRAEVARDLRIYGELHRFLPVLAHERGYRVAELPVNHRPRSHGRSRYGLERYLRGFLDLLTVSLVGRYRHRPLHLFGGLGLLLGVAGTAILTYLTVLKAMGEAIGHRPLLILGRAPRRRRPAALLARAARRDDPQPARGARRRARARTAPRGRDPPLAGRLRVLYFGTYERTYPRNAQVISCLRRAGVEVEERHVGVWEEHEHKWAAGPASALRLAAAQAAAATTPQRGVRRTHRRVPRSSRPAGRAACRAGEAGRLQPAALARGHVRRRPRALPARVGGRARPRGIDRRALQAADLVVADTEANADDLARRGRIPHKKVAVCFVGAEERVFGPAGSARAVRRALRRQADSPPGRGDRARGRPPRARAPVPHRRQRPAGSALT